MAYYVALLMPLSCVIVLSDLASLQTESYYKAFKLATLKRLPVDHNSFFVIKSASNVYSISSYLDVAWKSRFLFIHVTMISHEVDTKKFFIK